MQVKSVDEARAAMLGAATPLAAEAVALDQAFGRVLAQDIIARGAQPPFDASAMDGWAVRRADTPGRLRRVGESAAGSAYAGVLGAGEAVRIFTGAPVPAGADAIVIQENAKIEGDFVTVEEARADDIRKRGLDFAVGDILLSKGARLDGVALSLAAAAGIDPVSVSRRARVAILATGDELVTPGLPLGPDQIFESVSFGIAGLVRGWGAEAVRLKAASDNLDALTERMRGAAEASDVIVTIGGASVGDYDLVKPAAAALGAELLVDKVNVRPGKPVWFARAGETLLLGLPGNPASALACAHLFLRPLLARLTGADEAVGAMRAKLAAPLPKNASREHYLRARLSVDEQGGAVVTAFESQDSSRLTVFQHADALIRLPANAPATPAGALVDVVKLDRL
jgi:molybdopterin molybdotransferase